MDEDEKGNPPPIQSLGKFEEPNARFGFSLQMTNTMNTMTKRDSMGD